MLTARVLSVLAVMVAGGMVTAPSTALADDGPVTCLGADTCVLGVQKPGSPGSSTPGGAAGAPSVPVTRCNNVAACPATPGQPAAATPAQVAERAIKFLPLRGPQIGTAPSAGRAGLVGLPIWFWTVVTPMTWGPIARTAAVTGLAVTARAQATSITWSTGDGTQIVCANPGSPYDPAYGNSDSPTCGYRYPKSSRTQPGGTYIVTGTTTWRIQWWVVGGGATGVLTTTRQTRTAIRINELQVVTR